MREVYRTRRIWPPVEFSNYVFIEPPYISISIDMEKDSYVLQVGIEGGGKIKIAEYESKKKAIRCANNFINNLDKKDRNNARTIMAVSEGASYLPEF